jgi:hypothetical protein
VVFLSVPEGMTFLQRSGQKPVLIITLSDISLEA